MQKRIEKILGTVKVKDERWPDLFDRLDEEGRIDMKSVILILGIVLDELDGKL